MAKGDDAGAGGAAAVWRLWKDVATGIVDVGIALIQCSRIMSFTATCAKSWMVAPCVSMSRRAARAKTDGMAMPRMPTVSY